MARYYQLNDYYRYKFGGKVYKLAMDIGGTCPNRDGSRGVGGCIFCGALGSGEHAENGDDIDSAIARLGDKACGKYIYYLQSYSATYRSVIELDSHISTALSRQDIVGVALATRADCISEDMWGYLEKLNSKTFLTVELGLQTIRDDIALAHNRQHTFDEFLRTYNRLKACGIRVVVHIINGLVGESIADMERTAEVVGALRPDGIKIHCLHVLGGTRLAEMYANGEFKCLEKGEYMSLVARQIAVLPKETVVERVTGDGDRYTLIAPIWTLNKRSVINGIESELKRLGYAQGDLFNEKHG